MDFSGRGVRPFQQGSSNTPAPSTPSQQSSGSKKKGSKDHDNKAIRIAVSILGLLLVVLVAATIAVLGLSRVEKEADFVDASKTQAVFWDNAQSMQVYFGDIVSLTKEYVVLRNVFYIQSSTEGSENADDTQLIKLGCELHKPNDEMVINRDKVMFWENIQDDGKVAQAIADFKKNNPNGQNCAATNNSNVQGSTNAPAASQQTPANTSTGTTSQTNTSDEE